MNSEYLELIPINIQSKIVFLFCLFLLTTTPGFSSENFILKEKSLHTISSKHLQFLEGYNEFIDIDDLEIKKTLNGKKQVKKRKEIIGRRVDYQISMVIIVLQKEKMKMIYHILKFISQLILFKI